MTRAPHHGTPHKRARAAYLTTYTPGTTPCAIGGEPLTQPPHLLDLAHDDTDPTGRRYLGLTCQPHNRSKQRESPRHKKPHNWSKAFRRGQTTANPQPKINTRW